MSLSLIENKNIFATSNLQYWEGFYSTQYCPSVEDFGIFVVMSFQLWRSDADGFWYYYTMCKINENFHSCILYFGQTWWRHTSILVGTNGKLLVEYYNMSCNNAELIADLSHFSFHEWRFYWRRLTLLLHELQGKLYITWAPTCVKQRTLFRQSSSFCSCIEDFIAWKRLPYI